VSSMKEDKHWRQKHANQMTSNCSIGNTNWPLLQIGFKKLT
jgi:hypothetical protein